MRKIILSCILISLINRNVSAECPSPIKDTILTINAISQILGYSPKDIIWHIKERIYLNKITVPNKIYSANQRQKIKYLRKELKKKNVIINETIDTIEKWTVYVVDSAKFAQRSQMTTSNLLNSNNFYTDSKIDSSTFSQEVITFSNLIDFRIDFLGEPDEFSTPYNEIFWYPKAKFPIEVTHRGILDTVGFEFTFPNLMFFYNNYPAMLKYFNSYFGLWIDRSFERRKRIHVFQRN